MQDGQKPAFFKYLTTGNDMRINPDAFARGVDEVLLMKPIRRAIAGILHGKAQTKRSDEKPRGVMVVKVKCAKQHDQTA